MRGTDLFAQLEIDLRSAHGMIAGLQQQVTQQEAEVCIIVSLQTTRHHYARHRERDTAGLLSTCLLTRERELRAASPI